MVAKVKKCLLVAGLAAVAIGSAAPAFAGGYYGPPAGYYYGPGAYDGYYGRGYRHEYRRGQRGISNGQAVLLGVGALGLGLVLSDAFNKDRPRATPRYDDRPRADRGYPRYDDRYDVDRERRELENERARLENERLRLENAQRRRALGDDDDDGYAARGADRLGGKDGGGGRTDEDDLDRDLAGASGRLNYDRAFSACVADALRDAERRGLAVSTPATWDEAQPLGGDKVRFRADLGRGGTMVCDVGGSGVTRLDLAGI